jgi:hypothetical protein
VNAREPEFEVVNRAPKARDAGLNLFSQHSAAV